MADSEHVKSMEEILADIRRIIGEDAEHREIQESSEL